MSFTSLGLKQPILLGIAAAGYEHPTPIQEQAIPIAKSGRDIVGLGQTGSGKTAAYGLPMLDRLVGGESGLRGLILVPTRELCVQVAEHLRVFAQFSGLHVRTAFGGIPLGVQEAAIKRGLDVLVACPGRLLDHLQFNTVTLDRVEMLVLDEGDRMLDMGFMPQIGRILSRMPKQRQNLLFSATMPSDIERLVRDNFGEFERIQVGELSQAATTLTHRFESVPATSKERRLEQILRERRGTVLIFVKTKKSCEELGRKLQRAGLPADSIHGDKSAESRHVVLQGFIRGKIQHLVATDVAARGIDVSDIGLVLNFDMPRAVEDYVHRVGRTGRAGTEGEALSLVGKADVGIQRQILAHLGKTATAARIEVDGKVISGSGSPSGTAKGRTREVEAEAPRARRRDGSSRTQEAGRASAPAPGPARAPAPGRAAAPVVRRAADRAVTLSAAKSASPPRDDGFGDGIADPAPSRTPQSAGGPRARRR